MSEFMATKCHSPFVTHACQTIPYCQIDITVLQSKQSKVKIIKVSILAASSS